MGGPFQGLYFKHKKTKKYSRMNKTDLVFSASARAFCKAVLSGLLVLSIFMTILTPLSPAHARKKRASGENHKYAAFVIDASTGQVLHQSNADKSLYPASLTKVMTLLLVFEALDQGRLSLRDRVTISRHAASMPPSKIGLKPGSSIRVQDAIYAVVTKSANDVAAALGERVAGSESAFARRMTAKAQELGMTRTTFTNASGLHDPRQKSSARDMAKLARYVITTYPDYYRFYSKQNFTYAGHSYHNHNGLMKTYKGMDGMKTGYTNPAGFNLVASAVRNNRRVIGVVFGGRSAQSRNAHMAVLLDNAFTRLKGQPEVLMASATDSMSYTSDVSAALASPKAEPIPPAPRKPGFIVAAATLNKTLSPALDSAKKKALPNLLEMGSDDGVGTLTSPVAPAPAAGNTGNSIHLASAAATSPMSAAPAPSSWAIQVGAYSSRAATDKALHDSMRKLPVKYASLSPMIAPLKTRDGWLFRARLHGLSRNDAMSACRYLSECVPVAPKNN
jgi:D-alanyl-D-alanine carboxypeptidase